MRRALRAVYRASPQSLLAPVRERLRMRRGGPNARLAAAYRAKLISLFWRFVAEQHPADALPEQEFVALVLKYQRSGQIEPHTAFAADLWQLFRPDFRRRLPEYYDALALNNTMRFLEYAAWPDELFRNFVEPYRVARRELGRFTVLEVGAGIPHGLIYEHLREPGFCEALTVNDVDAPYSRFTASYCGRAGIPFRFVPAMAGVATELPAGEFGFVFAKDVFEHVLDPEVLLAEVLRAAAPRALVALDLEDKKRGGQHVSPGLSQLKAHVRAAGFVELVRTGNVTVYSR